jgi:catechol 2,3-dioxygenase-like lactoylglutathione lyase family enzyme
MKSSLAHIQLNILDANKSLPFYKALFEYFDYKIIDESSEHIGVSNGGTDFWIIQTEDKHKTVGFHRKNTGLNHLAFNVGSRENVDKFCDEFLKSRGITTLYDSPKIFPEYSEDYYAVFFEGPDRIKIEIMCK